MKIKVNELIVRYMENLGIKYIFGIPGAHILPIYDSLFDSNIQAILAKHEQGAAFMAGGDARASGGIGACISTAGPGATNLVTGIANAYADKQPILAITGEAPTYMFGKGGLQESSGEGGSIDQTALFKGITKYNKVVERTDYLAQVLNKTSKLLLSDNPAPVLLSFPFNIQNEMVDVGILDSIKIRKPANAAVLESPAIRQLTDQILKAKNPVIVAGNGCIQSRAQTLISQLSEIMDIPVATSLKGKGIINEQSALSLGSLGVTSSGCAYKFIVEKADLVMFLGASFNERTSYVWDKALLNEKFIIQIDKDITQLEKVYNADIAIHADIKEALAGVLREIERKTVKSKGCNRQQYVAELNNFSNCDNKMFNKDFALIKHFFLALEKSFPENAAIFDDNIIFGQNFFNVSTGNRYYPNSGISSLGHAIPAAIGASFHADMAMFAILGDGGFQMCCMEIMTAVNYNKPLNIVVFNNSTMGLIRKNQKQRYNERFINCDFINPDFQQLAASFGICHKRVENDHDIEELFSSYDLTGSINLIEIMIDKDAFPNYSSKR